MPLLGLLLAAPAAAQTERLAVDELKAQLDAGAEVLLIDVREDYEVESGSIPGSIHIPVGELEARMPDIPKDVRLVFF
jgi:rhodanese-related sulfurtransferase